MFTAALAELFNFKFARLGLFVAFSRIVSVLALCATKKNDFSHLTVPSAIDSVPDF